MDLFKGNQGKGEAGFTLIELLVVIGILAVLAAVAIPAYSRFFGEGEIEANLAELSNIQASMDAMMANHRLLYVDEPTSSTEYFDNLPFGCAVADTSGTTPTCTTAYLDGDQGYGVGKKFEYLHPPFLRIGSEATGAETPTKMCYEWDATGFVTQFPRENDGTCPP